MSTRWSVYLPSSVLGPHARKVTSAYLLCRLGRNEEAAQKLRKVQEVSQPPGYMYIRIKWPCTHTNTHTHAHKYMYLCETLVSEALQNQAYPRSYHPRATELCTWVRTYRHSCWPYSRVVTPVPVNKVYKCTYDPNLYSNQWILLSHGYPTGIFNPKLLPTPAPPPPTTTTTTTATTTCLLLSLQHFLVQWCCNHSQILLQCEAPDDGDSSLLLTEFGKVRTVCTW